MNLKQFNDIRIKKNNRNKVSQYAQKKNRWTMMKKKLITLYIHGQANSIKTLSPTGSAANNLGQSHIFSSDIRRKKPTILL